MWRETKEPLFWVLVLEGLVGLHRSIQLQLLQHYWLGHRLVLLWYWMICLGHKQRTFCCFWDCTQALHLDSFVDYEGYSVSSKGFFPTGVDIMVIWVKYTHSSPLVQLNFSSVAQPFPTICDRMNCSIPGFPVHHQLLELTVMPSDHLILCDEMVHLILCCPLSPCLQSSSASGSFQMSQFFTSCGQRNGVSASALVLLMTIEDWFPLG